MSNFTTELMSALFKGEGVEEIMRLELESAMNELQMSITFFTGTVSSFFRSMVRSFF